MPSFITDEKGYWHPAKEVAQLRNLSGKDLVIETIDDEGKKFKKTVPPGAPYIYEGPDRAALFHIWEEMGRPTEEQMKELIKDGKAVIGEGYRGNQEFLEGYAKARNAFGFQTVDEYLKYLGYDEKRAKERFEKNSATINIHDLPAKVQEIKTLGGGLDRVGNNHKYGAFGEIPDR